MPTPITDKFIRCQDECVYYLKQTHPRAATHRKAAIMLADPYRPFGLHKTKLGLYETFCDEMVRRALNQCVADNRVTLTRSRCQGLVMKLFSLA